MITLVINEIDYSENVVASNYSISKEDIYKTWTDGFLKEHRKLMRQRVEGTMDLLFTDMQSYNCFLSDLRAQKNIDNTYRLKVLLNKPVDEIYEGDFFIKYTPIRNLNGGNRSVIGAFKLQIQEA